MVAPHVEQLIHSFAANEGLSAKQAQQFAQYLELLLAWNKEIDLTAITEPAKIISHHFQDSLRITEFVDFSAIHMLADVGTGAGFPALPLKIKFPDLPVILIEVTHKRIQFLKTVIEALELEDIELYTNDWRTFLRKTDYPVDLFVARASLQPEELLRIFKPICPYRHAQLVYWASKDWQPTENEKSSIVSEKDYVIDGKKRRYIFFKKPKQG